MLGLQDGIPVLVRSFIASIGPLLLATASAAQPTFSVDYHGPPKGFPDTFTFLPITEGDILTPPAPFFFPEFGLGPPFPAIHRTAGFGPGGLLLPAAPGTIGLPAGIPGGIEVDALSYGTDLPVAPTMAPATGMWASSVDEWAFGNPGMPAPPNVATLSAPPGGPTNVAASTFRDLTLGSGPTCALLFPAGGNTLLLDGNGAPPPVFPPVMGVGLPEPTIALPGLPDMAANVDADADLDLVVNNRGGGTIGVYINTAGVFAPPTVFAAGAGPFGLAVAEVDGDGDSDAIVASIDIPASAVLLNGGVGIFGPPSYFTYLGQHVHAGDLDGDADADLVGIGLNAVAFRALRNTGAGAYPGPGINFNPGAFSGSGSTLSDFNGDGRPDIAYGTSGGIAVALGVFSPTSADVNNDAVPDECAVCPVVASQPSPATTCLDGGATFTIAATGTAPIGYQSQCESPPAGSGVWGDLVDGTLPGSAASASGTTTTTMLVSDSDAGAAVSFRCIATNVCGDVTSDEVALTVCAADFNCDSTVDFFDYLDFVDAFSSGGASADFNNDGVIDFFDYLDFVDASSTGCP